MDLALAPEHRRGHGALYGGLNNGRIDLTALRGLLARGPMPRAADGRLVLAVDVSPWLRPDAVACPDRSFCHTYGRGESKHQMIPGWPYSFVAALEAGRTCWTALLDAVRLDPGADLAAITTNQLRQVVTRLIAAGRWRHGDPDILIVLDAGYDAPRIAHLLTGLPVQILGPPALEPRHAPPSTLPRELPVGQPRRRAPAQAWRRVRLRRSGYLGRRAHDDRHGAPAATARRSRRRGTGYIPG
ncbi:transposase [Spirillospora sp. NBC_00431]